MPPTVRAHLIANGPRLLKIDVRGLSEPILGADSPRETSCDCVNVTVFRDEPRGRIGPRRRIEPSVLPPELGPPVESAAQSTRDSRPTGARGARGRVHRERLLRERPAQLGLREREVQRSRRELVKGPEGA